MIHAARAFVRRFREPIFPDTVEAMRRRLGISRNDAYRIAQEAAGE